MMSFIGDLLRRNGEPVSEHFPALHVGNSTVSEPAETVRVPKLMPKMCPRKAKKMARLTELNVKLLFADRPLTVTEVAGLMKCSVVAASRLCSEASFVTKRRSGRNVLVTHKFK